MNLTQNIRQYNRLLVRELGVFKPVESLTMQLGHILLELEEKGQLSIKELSKSIQVDPSTMSRNLKKLQKSELVKWENDAFDKRIKLFQITKKAKKLTAKIHELANDQIEKTLQFLKKEDQEILVSILDKYQRALRKVRLLNDVNIRPIQQKDNAAIERIIKKTLEEHDAVKPGTVYFDPQTAYLYEYYLDMKLGKYFIIEIDGKIIGGSGFGPVAGHPDTCELQKIYFLPKGRGIGLGYKMIRFCMEEARKMGYTKMYLESMPELKAGVKLYENLGFEYLDGPLGDTGHNSCDLWMISTIKT